jgi:hypothetical protein
MRRLFSPLVLKSFRVIMCWIICLSYLSLKAQVNPAVNPTVTPLPVVNDLQVTIHEEMLNNMMTALGEIRGNGEYSLLLIPAHYTWTLTNAHFQLLPGKADFVSDVKVETGPFSYTSAVTGNVDISYDPKTNLIHVKIVKAIFEVYTKMFGNKVHIKNIDLAEYFKDPFTFEGPMSLKTDMDFTMPDGKKKTLYCKPSCCELKVVKQCILVAVEVTFTSSPPPASPPALKPE